MTPSEFLEERNELILAIRDVDAKLNELFQSFGAEGTYRASAEARELLETRKSIAQELKLFDVEVEPLDWPLSLVGR